MATFDIQFTPNVTQFSIAFRAGTILSDIVPADARAGTIDPYFVPSPFDYSPLPSITGVGTFDPVVVMLNRVFGPRWQSG